MDPKKTSIKCCRLAQNESIGKNPVASQSAKVDDPVVRNVDEVHLKITNIKGTVQGQEKEQNLNCSNEDDGLTKSNKGHPAKKCGNGSSELVSPHHLKNLLVRPKSFFC